MQAMSWITRFVNRLEKVGAPGAREYLSTRSSAGALFQRNVTGAKCDLSYDWSEMQINFVGKATGMKGVSPSCLETNNIIGSIVIL